jgi:hypothetical protein
MNIDTAKNINDMVRGMPGMLIPNTRLDETLNKLLIHCQAMTSANDHKLSLPENYDIKQYLNDVIAEGNDMLEEDKTLNSFYVEEEIVDFLYNELVPAIDCFSPQNHSFGLSENEKFFGFWPETTIPAAAK